MDKQNKKEEIKVNTQKQHNLTIKTEYAEEYTPWEKNKNRIRGGIHIMKGNKERRNQGKNNEKKRTTTNNRRRGR